MDRIYKSKLLIPIVPNYYCTRSIAEAKLNMASNATMLSIKAYDGLGKSTLLAKWAANTENVCWYSLNHQDNDLTVFVNYIINAIRTIDSNFLVEDEKATLDAVNDIDLLVLLLSNGLIDIKKTFYLVLDDYHFITSEKVHTLISKLLNQRIPAFSLIVSSNSILPFDYSFLQGSDLLINITEDDIIFSRSEVKRYLLKRNAHETAISQYKSIHLNTYGVAWCLNALMPSLNTTYTQNHFNNSLEELVNDLVAQKTNAYSQNQKYMLALLFTVPYFNEELFSELAKEANIEDVSYESFIQLLLQSIFFIAEINTGTYAIHNIIRENFTHKSQILPEIKLSTSAYNILSAWCIKHGLTELAFSFYIRANAFEEAVNLLKQYRNTIIANGEWGKLIALTNELESLEVPQDLTIALTKVWGRLLSGDVSSIKNDMESIPTDLIKSETNNDLLGEYYLLKAVICLRIESDLTQFSKYAQKSVSLLSEDNYYPMGVAWLYYASSFQIQNNSKKGIKLITQSINNSENLITKSYRLIALSYVHWMNANLIDMQAAANQLIRIGEESELDEMVASAHYLLGIAHYNNHNKEKANEHLELLYKSKITGIIPHHFFGLIALIVLKLDVYTIDELDDLLDDLNKLTLNRGELRFYKYAKAITSLVYWRKNKDESSLTWARTTKYKPFLPMSFFISIPLVQAFILLGSNKKDQLIAMEIIQDVIVYTTKFNNIQFYIQARLLEAVLAQLMDKTKMAEESLLSLAKTIQDKGAKLSILVFDQLISSTLLSINIDADLKSIITSQLQLKPNESSNNEIEKEELTLREIEIFKWVRKNTPNKDIGEKLFISEKTVKRHISNIYKKIGATNRSEAIALAKTVLSKKK